VLFPEHRSAILENRGEQTVSVRKPTGNASSPANPASELRRELARKIALLIGVAEKQTTSIPGLTLHRRTAPTAPCSVTYEPGVIVIAQGRKQVNLGGNTFVYDSSR
jgi:AraC-type transcriptional regulator N-terminus